VALQGTLDTFSLPDVLRLLATTGKTGCLHLDGDRGRGRVWLDEGTLVAAAADRSAKDAPIEEVIFEMLRFDRGSFSFAVDERSPHGEEPADLEGTLRRAGQLLDEWRELEAVVPSLNHRVAMAPELTVEQVTIDAERWQALVAIAAGRPVGELGDALGQGELSITRTVSDLVELGIAVVQPPETSRPSSSSRRNVTDIGSRRAEEAGRRSARREAASGTDGMPRGVNWPRTIDTSSNPQVDTAEHTGRSSYRGEGPDDGSSRNPAPTKLPSRNQGGAQASATAPQPSGRTPVSSGAPTPPGGSGKADVAPQTRSRGSGSGSRSRSRARATVPATSNGNGHGNAVPLPTGPGRNGSLPTGPGLVTGPLATAPELTADDTGPGALARRPFPATPPGGVRGAGPNMQTGPLPIPDPARGPLLPPTLHTGPLSAAPLPSDTGQIPTVSASALPQDLSWAADDGELPIAPPMAAGQGGGPVPAPLMAPPNPGPRAAPSRLLSPPAGRPGPAPQAGDPAPHVVAMSPEARAAVEMTVGRAGGGQGPLQMAGATQEQIMGRGQLLQFLSTVRS
jgi:Domain of unknown function (DUF4388)